ncbi:MAG TPA: IS982 family transposase [Pyrinomonadaceae bacterium]
MDSLIIAVFCLIDDALPRVTPGRLRRRGPRPVLADSEVLTVELVGEYLGLDRDAEVFSYFRRHYSQFFPGLRAVHRTTFARQAANLWRVKEALWQHMLPLTGCDPAWALVDSFPVAVCRFARAPRSRTFRGEAGFGKDHNVKQTSYGFRLHARVAWPGVVTRLSVCAADASDVAVLEELADETAGVCLGDRNYWSPELHAQLRGRGLEMLVPFKKATHDPAPERSRRIASIRYRIETVFSQLCERFRVKRVWARDLWHLSSRLLRKVLAHTAAIILNRAQGHEPLRLAELLTN